MCVVPAVEQPDLYQNIETLLLLTVKKCLSDSTFHDCFEDKSSIRRRFLEKTGAIGLVRIIA